MRADDQHDISVDPLIQQCRCLKQALPLLEFNRADLIKEEQIAWRLRGKEGIDPAYDRFVKLPFACEEPFWLIIIAVGQPSLFPAPYVQHIDTHFAAGVKDPWRDEPARPHPFRDNALMQVKAEGRLA